MLSQEEKGSELHLGLLTVVYDKIGAFPTPINKQDRRWLIAGLGHTSLLLQVVCCENAEICEYDTRIKEYTLADNLRRALRLWL